MKSSIRRVGVAALGALTVASSLGLVSSSAFAAKPPAPTAHVSVTAKPTMVVANATSSSAVAVHVFASGPVSKAAVTLTSVDYPSGSGACGTLTASSGSTDTQGLFSTTYTSSKVVGFCTITATYGTVSSSVTLDQSSVKLTAGKKHDKVVLSVKPVTVKANGTSTATITAKVTLATKAQVGDVLAVTLTPLQKGACGTFSVGSPLTDSTGKVAITYTSSKVSGNCKVTVVEAATGAGAFLTIQQHA